MHYSVNPKAIKFRKFWGEKAELRRFKDGTIAESTGIVVLYIYNIIIHYFL